MQIANDSYCVRNLIQFLFFVAFLDKLASLNSPLCQIQACNCTTKTVSSKEIADVICSTIKDVDIFDLSIWINNNTNQSYPYDSVTFQRNELINLSKIFPTSKVVNLNLAENNISGIGDSIFQNLLNMKVLILSHNDLEIIHPDAFKGIIMEDLLPPLMNLKELRLDNNKLHTLDQEIFEHTEGIEILDLSYNPIGIIDHNTLSAIRTLPSLMELYLQYTQIKTLPGNMLLALVFLQILDLSGNPIEKIPKTLEQSHSLTYLHLNDTAFVNMTQESGFPKIHTLRVLYFCKNQFLVYIGERSLSNLTNLQELIICENIALREIDPLVLAYPITEKGPNLWPDIKKLFLHNNNLSYLDSELVARWDGLSELDIRGNSWTCDCENLWLIKDLMPIYLRIDEKRAKDIKCAAPTEMQNFSVYTLYERERYMRCLDLNGAHHENGAVILVGILGGVLIIIPVTLLLILGYRRKWYSTSTIFEKSGIVYSTKFYSASPTDDRY